MVYENSAHKLAENIASTFTPEVRLYVTTDEKIGLKLFVMGSSAETVIDYTNNELVLKTWICDQLPKLAKQVYNEVFK